MPNVRHSTVRVGPANVFYREAGAQGQPVLLLLHGFANSSHYFRHLMPKLAGRFHVIAQGVNDPAAIEPEAYWLDAALLGRPGMMDLQTDLKLDYKSNIERYPLYQQYLRTHRPPLPAIWGKNDPFFIPPGAEAFKRDVPSADDDFAAAILEMAVNT